MHAHCYFHEAINLMGDAADKVLPPVKGVPEHFIVIEQRLKEMDAMAIDMEVLSINPFWYGKDRDTASQIVKVQNEELAELCAAHPERFAAFASLTLQYPDLAVQQLETAVKKRGLAGPRSAAAYWERIFPIQSSIPSGPRRRTRRGAVHPSAEHAGTRPAVKGQRRADEHDRQSARHHHRAVASDLRGHARLVPGAENICSAHGGGYIGSYAARGDHACFVSPQNCNPNITLKKKPSEYLNQLYFDAMVFTPEGLRHLAAQVARNQVLRGSDHPIPWEQHPVDHVFATTTLSDKQKIAILGGNAAKLFGMKLA